MNELRTDVAGAMIWVDEYHKQLESRFMENFKKVPRWGGPIDLQVARYCDGLGNWVRANDQWSFREREILWKEGSRNHPEEVDNADAQDGVGGTWSSNC